MEQGLPLVQAEITIAEELTDQIHKQIEELESRLLVVLLPENTLVNPSDVSEEMPMPVPLADRLYTMNGKLRAARERISSLRIRIEL